MAERQTNRQTEGQTDMQASRKKAWHICGKKDVQAGRQTHSQQTHRLSACKEADNKHVGDRQACRQVDILADKQADR
jgi:hypothetical protein